MAALEKFLQAVSDVVWGPPLLVFLLSTGADKVQAMLKKVLDAFVNLSAPAAREVSASDSEVDAINDDIFQQVKVAVARDPSLFETLLQVLHIARHLERIADHATNIAEDLIYMIEGEIVRHRTDGQKNTVVRPPGR